jgi:hypothetical protein
VLTTKLSTASANVHDGSYARLNPRDDNDDEADERRRGDSPTMPPGLGRGDRRPQRRHSLGPSSPNGTRRSRK